MADKIVKSGSLKGRSGTPSPPTRPFQCQWHEGCPKSFNRKSDLQRHYRIHTNERPYACDYKPCEKTFIQRSALTVHRRTHTGDKPHKCPYAGCGKCFSDSSSLARHRRIHTNDKPYICKNPQCRKAFCRKTTMTKHFRKEHFNESIEHDEDADFSDVDLSDEEPSLDHDVDSPSSAEYQFDHKIKPETPSITAPNNYTPNLWPLPAQTAQRPVNHAVKLRSLSSTPQRSPTEQHVASQMGAGYIPRSSTLPSAIPRSQSLDMAMWQGPGLDSPTSISTDGSYSVQGMTPTSGQFPSTQSIPIRRTSLQPVDDIILDDPQAAFGYNHHPQQRYTSGPPPASYQRSSPHDFRRDVTGTPSPAQEVAQLLSIDNEPLIEAYQAPPIGHYSIPSGQSVSLYNDPLHDFKMKMEDSTYAQMPDAALPNYY